jgi:hypothetical protein
MKKLFLAAAVLCNMAFVSKAGVILLEGNYQGKNLYVQNPFAGSGVGFCVFEVLVNDRVSTDETNSSAFEIDLKTHNLKLGDKVEIKIKHKDDCKPRVLNPEALNSRATFEIVSIGVDQTGILKWKTRGETGKLTYIVEQFRWSKWVKVGEVEGTGTVEESEYSFKVTPHSGRNQFRVKQVDYTGQPRVSGPAEFKSSVSEITYTNRDKKITFSSETMFEIYDRFGDIVKKGYAKEIDISQLEKRQKYVLLYDNKMESFEY